MSIHVVVVIIIIWERERWRSPTAVLGEPLVSQELGVHALEGGVLVVLGLLDPIAMGLLVLVVVGVVLRLGLWVWVCVVVGMSGMSECGLRQRAVPAPLGMVYAPPLW